MWDALRERLGVPWTPISRGQGLAGALAIALLALWMAVADQGWLVILDGANLVFHEAGHPLFGIFGETAGLYGGTLGQLVFPAVVALAGTWRRHPGTAAVGVAWFGQNLGNIARYMADARAQELPLVGGGEHDWTAIFARWDALSADLRVAGVTRGLGFVLVIGSAAWLARLAWRPPRNHLTDERP